ncbi:hypothetical protein [uncultured Dokdonia sp.]|uniref:hypothetical protein n=1 Tax=uncultured Dokdonia sp. TaxID=575653 RepID=UPI0026245FD7|nr:hypothetical protein [uncultured Dokdonia sp.]
MGKGIDYYRKIIELKFRIQELKEQYRLKQITLAVYKQQLEIILEELKENAKKVESDEFAMLLNQIITNLKIILIGLCLFY